MSEALTKIEKDVVAAMKAREANKLGVLRMLVNRIKMTAKNDGNREVTDQDVIAGIQKSIKETSETRDIYIAKGVETSAQDFEISVLTDYLPRQMSEDELRAAITAIGGPDMAGKGKAAMGPIMAGLKNQYGGQYDAKLASTLVAQMVA